MKRVLLYAHAFPPAVGGAERLAADLAEGLAPRFALTVVTRTPRGAHDDAAQPYRVVRDPGLGTLLSLVRSADVVHLAGPALGPLALALLMRRPVVIEHHAYQAACPNGVLMHQPDRAPCEGHFLPGRYGRCLACRRHEAGRSGAFRSVAMTWIRRLLSHRAAANIAVSRHVAERIALPRTRVILHGVPVPSARRHNTPAGAFTVGFVGRLVHEKGVHVLLDAIAILSQDTVQARVVIIGDGPERSALEARARRLGLNGRVRFTGTLFGAALNEARRDLAAEVVPSIWEETAGFAAMEAMAAGVPVVASRIGGLTETVGDGGVLLTPGDAAALAAALRMLRDEPARRAELAAAAHRAAAACHDRERMLAAHAALWDEVSA